jgi:flagellar motility protein MotE (MotC chaperone)
MKRLVIYGLAATLLFAGSATISSFVLTSKVKGPESEGTAKAAHGDSAAKHAAEGAKHGGAEKDAGEKGESLRPVIQERAASGADENVQLASSLRDRLQAVREREKQLNNRQQQLEMVYQDIRGERTVLDELRKQLSEEMRNLNEKMSSVERRASDVEQESKVNQRRLTDLGRKQIEVDAVEVKNFNKIASMYDSMEPESAAKILQQLADSGKMETAVKVVAQMKDRQASKVLAELSKSDASLAGQVVEKLKGLKRVPSAPGGGAAPATPPPSAPVTAVTPAYDTDH